jgi:hypothetical protein
MNEVSLLLSFGGGWALEKYFIEVVVVTLKKFLM